MSGSDDRLVLDEAFFASNYNTGGTPPEDGVIPVIGSAEGGTATLDAGPDGFSIIPDAAGETPVFMLEADGVQVLSFDPLDVAIDVAAGQWRLIMRAETAAGMVERSFDFGPGAHTLGFSLGEVDDAVSVGFGLIPHLDGQDFRDVLFQSFAASEVNHAPGFDDGAGDGADGSGDDGLGGLGGLGGAEGDGSGADDPSGDGSGEDAAEGYGLEAVSGAVAGGALDWSVTLEAPGALRLLALPAGTEITDEAAFNAWFDQGYSGAIEAQASAAGALTGVIDLSGIDASNGVELWVALEDPAAPGGYSDAAMAAIDASGATGGGPLAELVWEDGHGAFAPTLELTAPTTGDVTAVIELYVDGGRGGQLQRRDRKSVV